MNRLDPPFASQATSKCVVLVSCTRTLPTIHHSSDNTEERVGDERKDVLLLWRALVAAATAQIKKEHSTATGAFFFCIAGNPINATSVWVI
jgi:hypothetical protein